MSQPARRRILLGITGGIAAYKAAELTRLLVKADVAVEVVMTAAAKRFITPLTLHALSGSPVHDDLWGADGQGAMAHIDLSRSADAIVVAPASADFLAKLAHGNADDLLSTLCLARTCPLIVAPAMNRQMWEHPATQRNMRILRDDGVIVFGPDSGAQACGEIGVGRMSEPEALCDQIVGWFQPKLLAGLTVVVTAGPTFERVDAVRGLTNQSSGRMGYAVARAARDAGARVILVSGPTAVSAPAGVQLVPALSAQDMLKAVDKVMPECQMFIAVAAVADYTPLSPQEQKMKKHARILTLELAPTADILANVANRASPPFCVGFAAESENLEDYAEAKRRRKNLPLLAANLAQDAFGADDSELILFDDAGRHPLPRAPKLTQARRLIEHAARLYRQQA